MRYASVRFGSRMRVDAGSSYFRSEAGANQERGAVALAFRWCRMVGAAGLAARSDPSRRSDARQAELGDRDHDAEERVVAVHRLRAEVDSACAKRLGTAREERDACVVVRGARAAHPQIVATQRWIGGEELRVFYGRNGVVGGVRRGTGPAGSCVAALCGCARRGRARIASFRRARRPDECSLAPARCAG
jgi:hypothetical protein